MPERPKPRAKPGGKPRAKPGGKPRAKSGSKPRSKRDLKARTGRRKATARAALGSVVLVGLLFAFVYPTRTFLDQRADTNKARAQLELLRSENARLAQETKKLKSDSEIERRGRAYGLVKPGEQPFVIIPAPPTAPPAAPPAETLESSPVDCGRWARRLPRRRRRAHRAARSPAECRLRDRRAQRQRRRGRDPQRAAHPATAPRCPLAIGSSTVRCRRRCRASSRPAACAPPRPPSTPTALQTAHDAYAAERDAALPVGYAGPRPHGGVGGTRKGVKCLHAHYAAFLVDGTDPVGEWVALHLADPSQPASAAGSLHRLLTQERGARDDSRRGRRHRDEFHPAARRRRRRHGSRRQAAPARPADAHHPARPGRRPHPCARTGGDRAHRRRAARVPRRDRRVRRRTRARHGHERRARRDQPRRLLPAGARRARRDARAALR